MNISESKNVSFIIEDTDSLLDIMGEGGTLSCLAEVSMHDDDKYACAEYDSDIKFLWTKAGTLKSRELVGEERREIYDYIFELISERDLMSMEEGRELDISEIEEKSLLDIIKEDRGVSSDNEIRIACVQHALDNYLSESIDAKKWENMDEEQAREALSDASIWQPFENHPYGFIIEQIENDATSVEQLVRNLCER